jgi:Lon-like protease
MLDDSTQPTMVPTTEPEGEAPPPFPQVAPDPRAESAPQWPKRGHRWWAVPLGAIGLLVPLAMLVSSFVLVDRYAKAPGSAESVGARLEFEDLPDDVTRYGSDGDLLFVTAGSPHLNALQWMVAAQDEDLWLLNREELYGKSTPTQEREIALQSMRDAKQVAEYVAYQHLGFDAELLPGPIVVQDMVCLNGSTRRASDCDQVAPAGEFLERGATITAVDGVATPTILELAPVMAGKVPGDPVTVRYRPPREDDEREATFATMAPPDEPDRAIIGFVPHDTRSVELPFRAVIDTNRIGGPSAGLAFTLTLIDELSPGALTGGRDVAVTGTINDDGTVGAIGSLRQKVVAVLQGGGDYFLVPSAQGAQGRDSLAEARQVAGDDLEIVPVANLEEALAAIAARGGEPYAPAAVG